MELVVVIGIFLLFGDNALGQMGPIDPDFGQVGLPGQPLLDDDFGPPGLPGVPPTDPDFGPAGLPGTPPMGPGMAMMDSGMGMMGAAGLPGTPMGPGMAMMDPSLPPMGSPSGLTGDGPGVACPNGRISFRTCNPGMPVSCQPDFIFYCFAPDGPFGPAACCRRKLNCPRDPFILCTFPRPECIGDFSCPSGQICCNSPCGRRCTPPDY